MSQNDPLRNLPLVKPTEPRETTAANWQIVLTTIAIVAILAVFFWGINNQRGENSGEQATAPQATPATPQSTDSQSGQAPASTTTGQGGNDQGNAPQDDKANPPSQQPTTNPGQNGQPNQNNGQPAQPGSGGH